MKKTAMIGCLAVGAVLLIVVLIVLGWATSAYNSLITLGEAVDSQWAQVENVYQRRADLVPNLVATVRGAADFERETFTAVTEARAKVGQISAEAGSEILSDPAAFERFQAAQSELSSALSRLLVTVENYPELRATDAFRDLQVQLEGAENRIAVERRRYNEAAREFNTRRQTFPTAIVANFFGGRFRAKPYFEAQEGAEEVPRVEF